MKNIKNYVFVIISFVLGAFFIDGNYTRALDKVVINANTNGEATNVYEVVVEAGDGTTEPITEFKQFTRSRELVITINIDEETLEVYDSKFDICEIIPEGNAGNVREMEVCNYYETTKKNHNFQLSGRNDGEKEIKIKFYSNYINKAVADTITKTINLDTTGPVITLEGGEYIYVPNGKSYDSKLGATCIDDSGVQSNEGCTVIQGEVNIDRKKSGYQYIKYTATDFLGNEVNVLRKVMFETSSGEEGVDWYWYFAGFILLVTVGGLTVKVIKNKDKQKNQSVL